jgi:uncharacterized membrane protein YqjE
VSSPPPSSEPAAEQRQSIAAAVAEVSERATLLIREEIELAKAEVAEKASRLARGAVVGVVAGVFLVMSLMFALVGCAYLLYFFLPGNDFTFFWGFFAMAVILALLGLLAGVYTAKAVKKSSPPMPNMAIEQARKIRETVTAGTASPTRPTRAVYGVAEPPSAGGAHAAAGQHAAAGVTVASPAPPATSPVTSPESPATPPPASPASPAVSVGDATAADPATAEHDVAPTEEQD